MECEILKRSLKDSACNSKLKLLKEGEDFGVEKPGGEKRLHIGPTSEEEKWDRFFFPKGNHTVNVTVYKIDLIKYMIEAKKEYLSPQQSYRLKISDYYDTLYQQTLDIPEESFQICFEKNTDNKRYYLSRPNSNPLSKNYNFIVDICLPLVTDFVFWRVKDGNSYYFYLKPEFTTPNSIKSDSFLGSNLQQVSFGVQGTEYVLSYLTALRTKPFMLLAGISGTGKSRIVRKLAQATTTQEYNNEEDRWMDNRPENFELIQVKPNWHNSMDVVGFYSNISKKYEFTPFVEFIVKAWQHKDTPYFLCLDEMNLAPVEEYFAEFLSAIESRSTDENNEYITDPIIKPFKDFGKDACEEMLKHLLGEARHTEANPLAIQFEEKGLTLPPNLMVMGTVNMDETTFSFSRKVLDRAMSVEMNVVDYDKFLSGESEQFPLLTDINELLVKRPQQASEVKDKVDSNKIISYLKDVNDLLEGTPFKLGYRAANEAMLYVAANRDFAGDKFSIGNALDDFTMMKILSRIEGDDNRLAIEENDPRLTSVGADSITDTGEDRINLLNCLRAIVRKHIGSNTETEKKINSMYRTLEREHFVSYWA